MTIPAGEPSGIRLLAAEHQFIENSGGTESPQSQHGIPEFVHLLIVRPIADHDEGFPDSTGACYGPTFC